MAELIPVRAGEELNVEALAPCLKAALGDQAAGPWSVLQYSAGHSNLTYRLSNNNQLAVVLRRPPRGPVAPRAHDMLREAKFLTAIHPAYRWAPRVYAAFAADSALGVPFFVMESRSGVLVDRAALQGHGPDTARRISEIMVRRLADLHAVDWRATGLKDMVRPEGFMQRQAVGWVGRYQRAKTDEVDGADELCTWLVANAPATSEFRVIHYDYKLDNVLFNRDFSDLTGVFDWEMATVGDPLADLAVAVSYWSEPADGPNFLEDNPVTNLPGFYSREDWVQAYADRSGADIHHFGYYLTFAYFKLAVIIAQIYYRYRAGQTQDARFAQFGTVVRDLVETARRVQSHAKGDSLWPTS